MERRSKHLAQTIKAKLDYNITVQSLSTYLQGLGYRVLFYGEANNRFHTQKGNKLLHVLDLEDYAARANAFTFHHPELRAVFIKTGFGEYHTTFLLAHELYHVLQKHDSAPIQYFVERVQDNAANYFAAYLLDQKPMERQYYQLKTYAKHFLLLFLLLLISLSPLLANHIPACQEPSGQYYVTPSGNKYHREDCQYIRVKTNVRAVTKEEIRQRHYTPCAVCQPPSL